MAKIIALNNREDYANQANHEKAVTRLGLGDYRKEGDRIACRKVITRKPEGKWTAIFLVTVYFDVNKTGGYVMFAASKGCMPV